MNAEVATAVREASAAKLPIFILGGGTNLLLCDKGFDGLVLRPVLESVKFSAAKKTGETIVAVGAGTSMAQLLYVAATRSLSGLEWAGGCPVRLAVRFAATRVVLAAR